MKWDDIDSQRCSVARSLAIVGDRWTLLCLREMFSGHSRFEHLLEGTQANRATLSDRLQRLVEHKVVSRHKYQDRPARYEYRLTPKGADLLDVILALTAWGDKWASGDRGVPNYLLHRECGEHATPVMSCDKCGEPIAGSNIAMVPNPNA